VLKTRKLTGGTAERNAPKDPLKYMLPVADMVENDYPVPSYLAETFERPPGWVETPQPVEPSVLNAGQQGAPKILAIDCEMVRSFLSDALVVGG
jgi:RNA exonuclease 1